MVHSDVEGKEEESVIGVYEVQNVSSSFPSVKVRIQSENNFLTGERGRS